MKTIRQINIENRQNYFFNDMTNVNDFNPSLLNIDEVLFESNNVITYDIKFIKNLNGLNSLNLVYDNLDAYIEKIGENKYMIFASTEKNKMMLKNYAEVSDEIKEQTELISDDKMIKYGKDFMKIRFKTNDLPLSKIINIPVCVVIVSSILKEDGKYYLQVLLHDCFYKYKENINPPIVYSINSDKSHYSNPLVV